MSCNIHHDLAAIGNTSYVRVIAHVQYHVTGLYGASIIPTSLTPICLYSLRNLYEVNLVFSTIIVFIPKLKARKFTAHVPCHVTRGERSETTTYLEFPTPICLSIYTTPMSVKVKGVYS